MSKKKKLVVQNVEVTFILNGKKVTKQIRPSLLLIDFIRDELSLAGTKPGCLEGECGACSVLIDGAAVNSCSMIKHGAVQCGFCSSGMTMSIKSMQIKYKKDKKKPSKEEIKKGLEGNLCRCTGYVKIIEAAEAVINKVK